MNAYQVNLAVFQGPMDLLMHLIEKDQLDIYDIPIAAVTEQYLAYIKAWEEFNIEIASEFLVMAATLLQIKSRMLLPKPPISAQDFEEEDPRRELVDRLLEYRCFKQAALLLADARERQTCYHVRTPQHLTAQYVFPDGLSLDSLLQAFAAIWESTVAEYAIIDRETVSVQDKMQDIVYLLRKNPGPLELDKTLIRSGTREEMIAAFLAILELLRLKRIRIQQTGKFGPIYLYHRSEVACSIDI
ncbi:MAG TPA: segregation/condensation protein A [Patescibacteria group bacterium]|nr:segregation/condensation protein A [Patescibacteria group bacterium]